jgi:hypothetical protein
LALFGRWPPQRVDGLGIPASENLHISGSGGPWIVREYFDETPNFVAGTLCVRAKCFSD